MSSVILNIYDRDLLRIIDPGHSVFSGQAVGNDHGASFSLTGLHAFRRAPGRPVFFTCHGLAGPDPDIIGLSLLQASDDLRHS